MTALHGFLGRPADWDSVFAPRQEAVVAPDWLPLLAEVATTDGTNALPRLANQLNEMASKTEQKGSTLIGYSMGGRIAVHMLIADSSNLWDRAIIVSASPGLADPEERSRRRYQDQSWAEKFRIESWSALMAAWNGQPVFGDSNDWTRAEEEFDRAELATALLCGSVANQEDLRGALASCQAPVLWVAGAEDLKYSQLARECAALNPRFQCAIIPGAGHRVPWAQTEQFRLAVSDFIANSSTQTASISHVGA